MPWGRMALSMVVAFGLGTCSTAGIAAAAEEMPIWLVTDEETAPPAPSPRASRGPVKGPISPFVPEEAPPCRPAPAPVAPAEPHDVCPVHGSCGEHICMSGAKAPAPRVDSTDFRVVQVETTSLTPEGRIAAEVAYVDRNADRGYQANAAKLEMQTGRGELRYGLSDTIEVGAGATWLPANLTPLPGAPPFPWVSSVDPLIWLGAKHADRLGESDWRYAVGGNLALGQSSSEQYALPDDRRDTNGIYALLSRPLGDEVDTTVGAGRAWLPGTGGLASEAMDSLSLGLRYRPATDWSLGVEAIHESLPATGRSGLAVLAGSMDRTFFNTSVRKACGGLNVEAALHRIDDPAYRQFDLAVSRTF